MPQETTEPLVQYNTKDFSGSRTGQNTVNIIETNLKINSNHHEIPVILFTKQKKNSKFIRRHKMHTY